MADLPKGTSLFLGVWQEFPSGWKGIQATNTSDCPLAKATFGVIFKRHSYLTPELWKEIVFTKSPCQELTGHLAKIHTRVSIQRTHTPAVTTI